MPAFEYRALDERGKVRKGIHEADSARQVRQALREKGWVALEVEEGKPGGTKGWSLEIFSRRGKLSGPELALFTRQLATLIKSGLPVEQALSAVARQAPRRQVEHLVLGVRSKVFEGYSLARSLGEHSQAFPEMYRATVAAGEQSGHLEQVLEQLADYLETRADTGRAVFRSLLYPLFIMVFSILIIAFLMTYVVPRMMEVFARHEEGLPTLTRLLVSTSEFFQNWTLALVVVMTTAVVIFLRAMKRPEFRMAVHRRLVEMPLSGPLLKTAESARLASTLGILSRSGVPLVEGLAISGQVVGNLAIREAVRVAANRVREGGSLSKALELSGYFPPMMVQMVASGEVSGELDRMLTRAAEYQERELNNVVNTTVGLLGPVMLLLMAGIVVLIVLGMMLPILQMNALFGIQ